MATFSLNNRPVKPVQQSTTPDHLRVDRVEFDHRAAERHERDREADEKKAAAAKLKWGLYQNCSEDRALAPLREIPASTSDPAPERPIPPSIAAWLSASKKRLADDELSQRNAAESLALERSNALRVRRESQDAFLQNLRIDKPYVPLTNHPDFQRSDIPRILNNDYDNLLRETFSRVRQNPNPDPFFLKTPAEALGWKSRFRGSRPGSVRRFEARKITPRDTPEAIKRRKRMAGSLWMYEDLGEGYTPSEAAALRVIAGAVIDKAASKQAAECDLSKKEVADLAGVRYTSVSNAQRKAMSKGHIRVEWRDGDGRRYRTWQEALNGTKSMSCIITFCGKALVWLRKLGGALKNMTSLTIQDTFFIRPAPP